MARKSPARNLFRIFAVALVTALAGLALILLFGDRVIKRPERAFEKKEVSVFFSDSGGTRLTPEKRWIRKAALQDEIRGAVEELLRGSNTGLGETVPGGTRLLKVAVKGSTAELDFSRDIIEKHTGGSSGEMQTVYSIVDTVALNFPEIKRVQILVEGKKEETIAGHIDITMPLGPDTKIIRTKKTVES